MQMDGQTGRHDETNSRFSQFFRRRLKTPRQILTKYGNTRPSPDKGKVKSTLQQTTKDQRGGAQRYSSILSLTSVLDGVGGQCQNPAALSPGKKPCTHCIGCWVGPRAGLDECGKSRPPLRFDPRTVKPLASRYTDYANSVHHTDKTKGNF
jgi:hypothetical protein